MCRRSEDQALWARGLARETMFCSRRGVVLNKYYAEIEVSCTGLASHPLMTRNDLEVLNPAFRLLG